MRTSHELNLTVGSRNDQPQLRRNDDAGNRLLVPRQSRPRRWHVPFADNRLGPRVPVPEEYGAVGRTGGDVAIRRDVALRPGKTSHHPVVSEYDLDDLGGLRGEDAEAVVPEAARDQEFAVHGGDEAVRSDLHVLAEIVAQVAPLHRIRAVVGLGCNRTFIRERNAIRLLNVCAIDYILSGQIVQAYAYFLLCLNGGG